MTPARKTTKAGRTIPVRVESRKRSTTKRSVPAVVPPPAAVPPPPKPPEPSPLRQPVHQLPAQDRHRLMWAIVAIGMFLILLGWALTLGYELRNPGREFNLLTDLTKIFRGYRLPDEPSPQEQEIRQLEEQVFPQF